MKKLFLLLLVIISFGASAQQSLFWQLNTDQTFTPTAIPNMVYWFKADEGVTATGGLVSSWANFGTGGNPMTVLTGAAGPTLTTLNGQAALRFDGATTAMVTTTASSLGNNNTLVIVFKRNTAGFQILASQSSSDYIGTSDASTYYFSNAPATASGVPSVEVVTLTASGFEKNLYANNNLIYSASTQTINWGTLQVGKWTGGNPWWWNGWVMEILYYNNVLTDLQRNNVYDYLKNKYNIL